MRYNLIKQVGLLAVLCLFSACGSITYLDIETYNPATITFPEKVKKVLVVNNAVPQSSDVGYELKIYGIEQDTCRAVADSALYYACKSLGNAIVEANYFEDVLLYNSPTRTDDLYLADEKLSYNKVRMLCRETGADAVITFDRLLFQMKKNVIAYLGGYVSGETKVNASGVIRVYLPERTSPMTTIMVSDSVAIFEMADDLMQLNEIMPSPDESLSIAGRVIGHNSYPLFVPYWQEEPRWYFKGNGARWKEATAYADAQKWDQAAELWNLLYQNGRGKAKAKAASNMAFYEEMQGRLQKAYDWSILSYDLFVAHQGKESKEVELLGAYKQALAERIAADTKLNIQFGEK
ncbi:hypothetical protein M2137_001466 [Parabacteroides sp. PFB2-10]|uniref:DUF6340 family protein n=1 Tax=Parabacteroides sp. PFB2-10 TaxID=1742405 RepID=UPI0024753A98|nr:DUF6340 family protein [Parabacteroides sp. PFB2-10]MDH6312691.1 hypothetical protein [Parabacteroides sp. PFB2-10]MDL2244045.1 DUF6340 family protein [Parabacteroides sp. OttesenSCG-928-J18]